MKCVETNKWAVLNRIIYYIYAIEDMTKMRRKFLEHMTRLISFDCAEFRLAERKDGKAAAEPVYFGKGEREPGQEENQYLCRVIERGKSFVYRKTDAVAGGDGSFPGNGNFLCMVFCREGRFLGTATFYRTAGRDDFRSEDVLLLNMLRDHMALRLERGFRELEMAGDKLTITAAVEEYELTKREETILRLLLAGLDNDHICDELVISVNTLKKHVLNIYRKLGIRNRVQMFKMIRERE